MARKKTPLPAASITGLDRTPVLGTEEVQFLRQSLFSPLRDFTPQRLVCLLEEREAGFLYECIRVWEAMARRDDVICTVKAKSEDAVAQRQWSVLHTSAANDDASLARIADEQRDQLRYFWNNITVKNVWDRNDTGGFTAFVRLAMQAKSFGHGAWHFAWRPSAKGLTAELEYVPAWMFENTSGELRYLGTQVFGIYGEPLDPVNWQTFCGKGLMEPASIAYAYKHLGLDTWIQYCDRWAGGVPVGKTNAKPNTTEWNALKTAVKGIRRDRGAVIGNGAELTMLETSGNGVTPSSALVERIDRALSSMFRGGDLSTLSSSSGQGTGANQQSKEALLIEASDCQAISELMQRIERRVIAWHHGANAECLAYTVIKGPNLADTDTELKVDEAASKFGIKLSKSDWLERYQRTEADDEADALSAPQAVPLSGASEKGQVKSEKGNAADIAANSNTHHDEHGRFASTDGGKLPARWEPTRPMPGMTMEFTSSGEIVLGKIGPFTITANNGTRTGREPHVVEVVTKKTKQMLEGIVNDPVLVEALQTAGIHNIELADTRSPGKPAHWTMGHSNGTLIVHQRSAEFIEKTKNELRKKRGVAGIIHHEAGHGVWNNSSKADTARFGALIDQHPEVSDHVGKIVNVKPPAGAWNEDAKDRLHKEVHAEVHASQFSDPKWFATLPAEMQSLTKAMHAKVQAMPTNPHRGALTRMVSNSTPGDELACNAIGETYEQEPQEDNHDTLPRESVRADLQPVRNALAAMAKDGTEPTNEQWAAITDEVMASGHLEDALRTEWFRAFAAANGLSASDIEALITKALVTNH